MFWGLEIDAAEVTYGEISELRRTLMVLARG